MWWKTTLLVLVLILVCFVGGLYAGSALFLKLTAGNAMTGLTWHTLWDARHLALNDRRMLFVPWSWCLTAAITFLPVGITLFALYFRLSPTTSLHGDARFANAQELRQFEYKGEYLNTSKK
ncbi:hypothetical protein JH25_27865 [Pseudomonas sp. BRG-100]|uniref:hypothetical protein n=1 Tax=Pseudomonas sp. BRG-100 TaxID=1524267 RepID=UPI0004E68408|nr:hypothetical protein [Pseudomonas sp. BRG-100]KFF42186.1 hypothetical protein JH25_27865 [Pseudomonas sp. BRG-100]